MVQTDNINVLGYRNQFPASKSINWPLTDHNNINKSLLTAERLTCSPSMASRSMLGVSLDACLKVKLLQSMMRMKPLTCSSGSSIIDSNDSRIALSMSTNVYLRQKMWQQAKELGLRSFRRNFTFHTLNICIGLK